MVPAHGNRALRACAAFRGDVLIVESEHETVLNARAGKTGPAAETPLAPSVQGTSSD